jgi:hypothetical protein
MMKKECHKTMTMNDMSLIYDEKSQDVIEHVMPRIIGSMCVYR